jgi:hypothetical protein
MRLTLQMTVAGCAANLAERCQLLNLPTNAVMQGGVRPNLTHEKVR